MCGGGKLVVFRVKEGEPVEYGQVRDGWAVVCLKCMADLQVKLLHASACIHTHTHTHSLHASPGDCRGRADLCCRFPRLVKHLPTTRWRALCASHVQFGVGADGFYFCRWRRTGGARLLAGARGGAAASLPRGASFACGAVLVGVRAPSGALAASSSSCFPCCIASAGPAL